MIGRKVPGSGNLLSKVFLCGEGPGRQESVEGRPFCGASGVELDYLYLRRAAKLRREDLYTTNLVKWRTDEQDSDPTEADILRDEPELLAEIEVCNPTFIVAIGRVAAGWFLRNNMLDLEKYHGVPVRCTRYPDKILLPVYHPAAGLHSPERYLDKIYWDFEQLGKLVRGEIACHPVPGVVHYTMVSGEADGEGLPFDFGGPIVAIDTEGSVTEPWGLSVSAEEERAFVLRGVTDSPAKSTLRRVLESSTVVGHNILHDLNVLDGLGVPISSSRCEDSMLEAYLLPWLPRRLKALSFKLCGIEQEEYEDIIKEPEERLAKEYLERILSTNPCPRCSGSTVVNVPYKRDPSKFKEVKCDACSGDGTSWPAPQAQLLFDTDPAGRIYKPQSIGRRVRAILKRGTGLREGWQDVDEQVRAHVEGQLGRMREPTLDDIPLEKAIHYSAADADCTLRVHNILSPMLKVSGLQRVYEIDKGIIPIIHKMHTNGILVDVAHFSFLEQQFTSEQSTLVASLAANCGRNINLSSPLQVAEVLYDTFKLKPVRGKRSTDEKTLEALKIRRKSDQRLCEFIDLITDYRELDKLLGTYVRPLLGAADVAGRVHTQFLLHVTATGRLSSRHPNLQNIPTKTERGRLIRKGFIPRSGCRLVSVDLDQVELRVAAHLSQDENMIEVFRSGKDIHRATAALIYGKPIEEISTQERLLSKTINFLILYGGGANKLNSELSLLGIQTTKDQCVEYINGWFRAYPRVRDYIESCHRQAKSAGYVECLFGRRRYVWGVHSCIDKIRDESFKWATNFPVQATAAALLKIWMRLVWNNVLPVMGSKGHCEPLLTVHDELIFEVEEGLEDNLIDMVIREAAQSAELLVPIKAKGTSAYNWSDLK